MVNDEENVRAGISGDDIIINGGIIYASGGNMCAGIGGNNLTINGGTIYATGGKYGAGIGGNYAKDTDGITINDGIVYATGGEGAAGIGGGIGGGASNITISGGQIYATGGAGAAGIGGGVNQVNGPGNVSNITLEGGTVTAIGGDWFSAIGETYAPGAGIGTGGNYHDKYASDIFEPGSVSDIIITGDAEVKATAGSGTPEGAIAAAKIGLGGNLNEVPKRGLGDKINVTDFTGTIEGMTPFTITAEALPEGLAGTSYDWNFSSNAEVTWSLGEGSLPEGLLLDSAGEISGILSEKAGLYTFSIKAENEYLYVEKEFSILVVLPISSSENQISGITENQVFEPGDKVEFTVIGGGMNASNPSAGATRWLPVDWSIEEMEKSGNFDEGFTKGILAEELSVGTNTLTVSYVLQKYMGTEWVDTKEMDSKSVTFYVKDVLNITTISLPDGYAGSRYSYRIDADGLNLTWSLIEGELPGDLRLLSSGTITGTLPQTPGIYTFKVKGENGSLSGTKEFSIMVLDMSSITGNTITGIAFGQVYMRGDVISFNAIGGGIDKVPSVGSTRYIPKTWEVGINGTFESGYTQSFSSENLPAGENTLTVTYQMQKYDGEDWLATTETDQMIVKFYVKDYLVIDSNLMDGIEGKEYSQNIVAQGENLSWRLVDGNFPAGLSLDTSGKISGVPGTRGLYTFTVKGENLVSCGTKEISLLILEPVSAAGNKILYVLEQAYIRGENVDFKAFGEGMEWEKDYAGATRWRPEVWEAGISGDFSTGYTQRFSTEKLPAGRNTLSVTFVQQKNTGNAWVDTKERDTKSVNFMVKDVLSVTGSLSDGRLGEPYSQMLQAKGDDTTWTLVSGRLPDGLTLDSAGNISGTPKTVGSHSFTVRGENSISVGKVEITILILDIVSKSENRVWGIVADKVYEKGTKINFTANGGGYNFSDNNPYLGDTRWIPESWKLDKIGDFSEGFTQSIQTKDLSEGSHTLKVTFALQKYNGTNWSTLEDRDVKNINFSVKSTTEPPVVEAKYTGLKYVNGQWLMYEDNVVTYQYNDLVKYNGSWWYVWNSKVDFSYTGLCKYAGSWWYIKNGKLDFGYTGLCKYNGSWWYVKEGKLDFGYTGLCKYNGSWWYVKEGKLDFGYTGLCKYNGSWWYVKEGKLDFGYTGLCKYNGSWWYVKGGILSFGYTGLCKYNGSWWYVEGGILNFGYTGLCKYNGSWWYVKEGKLDFGYTGLCKYNGSWWYIKGGILDFGYTGLCKYNGSWWYIQNGILNWNYTGETMYGGSYWYVRNGVMVGKA